MKANKIEKHKKDQFLRLSPLIKILGLSTDENSQFDSIQKYYWDETTPFEVQEIKAVAQKQFGKNQSEVLCEDVGLILLVVALVFKELHVHYDEKTDDLQKLVHLQKILEEFGYFSSYEDRCIDYISIKFKPNKLLTQKVGAKSLKFHGYTAKLLFEEIKPKINSYYENLIKGKADGRQASSVKEFLYKASYSLSILLMERTSNHDNNSIIKVISNLYTELNIFDDLNIGKHKDFTSTRKTVGNWIKFGKQLSK